MEKSDTDYTWPISNAIIRRCQECTHHQLTASELMASPAHPRLGYLKRHKLAYVPFPEKGVLEFSDRIYLRWSKHFRSGVITLADYAEGEKDEKDPLKRYSECASLSFQSSEALRSGGFHGAFLLWIEYPSVCMSIFVSEYSGFVCPAPLVEPVFGSPLATFVQRFSEFTSLLHEEEGRRFFDELAPLYQQQWALRQPTEC